MKAKELIKLCEDWPGTEWGVEEKEISPGAKKLIKMFVDPAEMGSALYQASQLPFPDQEKFVAKLSSFTKNKKLEIVYGEDEDINKYDIDIENWKADTSEMIGDMAFETGKMNGNPVVGYGVQGEVTAPINYYGIV